MGATVRTTISVPKELKARMEADGSDINWSAVASRAFEEALAGVITKRGVRDMQDVIDRLKASQKRSEDEDIKAGREAGESWAMNLAEAADLRRLNAVDLDDHDWLQWLNDDVSAYDISERFYFLIRPEDDGSRDAARDFWESDRDAGRDIDSAYIQGFIEGAQGVWDKVKDKL